MSFYVTTPIFYGNGSPHLGHAYTTMAADVMARHMRQRGEDVFFLTGTDEHGEPIAEAAEREGITPQELVDRTSEEFREMVRKVDATNDFFIRTTDGGHVERVQELANRIYENGHVYKGTYEGWFCPRCADFKGSSEVGPDETCPIHEIPLTREEQENWFFRLSAFQEDLEKLYAGKKGLSNEQQLGLGVVRLLSKGPQDQSALQALNKTLEQIDWKRNQKIICATQNALAAAGKDVKVLAECSKSVSLAPEGAAAPAPPASAASEAAPAGKSKDTKN